MMDNRYPNYPSLAMIFVLLVPLSCQTTMDETPSSSSNHPPTIDRISVTPSTEILPGDTITLSAAVSDPENGAVSALWSAPNGTLETPTDLSTRYVAPDILGPIAISLEVLDPQNARATLAIEITVGYTEKPDSDRDGYSWQDGDCNDADPAISPSSPEIVDGKDNDCDGLVDEASIVSDDDGDRWSELDGDCDDSDPTVYPTHPESADGDQRGIDNNCNGVIDENTFLFDDDGDGFSEQDNDCLDSNPLVYPGALEIADGLDNNCNGIVDETTVAGDDDLDGFAELDGDCNDANPEQYPGATEYTDGLDNNCDGRVDEGSPGVDDDLDGFTEEDGDCNDEHPAIYPGAPELADGLDNNCDATIDEGTVRGDDDNDGFSETDGDCNDDDPEVSPVHLEVPDNIDNDCDGLIDEETTLFDNDGDGLSQEDGDCDDTNPLVGPDAEERADGLDNDCDGIVDEDTYRSDDDLDGYSEVDGDCDDLDPATYPGAEELPDGLDNDCDGQGDTNMQPVAVPTLIEDTLTCEDVILDGSASFDPDGDPLIAFYWYLVSAPDESQATNDWILDQTSESALYTPDLPGTYELALIVSDGLASSNPAVVSVEVEDRGFNSDPIAEAGTDQELERSVKCAYSGTDWVCPQCEPWTVSLDGSQSTDPEGDRLFYFWSVSSTNTSEYSLEGAATSTPVIELKPPPAEYGRSNNFTLFLKLEINDCLGERDVDSIIVSYTCTGY